MNCEYHGCKRKAKYFMGWYENDKKKFGYVCSTHDNILGRTNLIEAGMTLEEAQAFKKYAKETEE